MDAMVRQKESAVDRLVGLVNTENPFDMPFSEALPRQLEAINERFKDRVDKIKLLQNRAESGGIAEIRRMADIVPLLFAHTAYKSYPEGLARRAEMGPHGPLARHGVDPPGRADGHARGQRPRRLAAAAREPGPLRLLLQRHDR